MKTIKRIYKWILISIIMQLIMLSYFNFIYLPGRSNIKATFFEDGGKSEVTVSLPQNAADIKVSFDGQYLGYTDRSGLAIVETKTGKNVKIIDSGTEDLSYYRWLPDRDMVIYALCDWQGRQGTVQINTYEVGTNVERSYPLIEKLPSGSKVLGLELSILTNIVYIKISINEIESRIYKFNIMDDLSFVTTIDSNINIRTFNYSDALVYAKGRKLTIIDGISDEVDTVFMDSRIALLEVDSKDNIYTAEFDEKGKVVRIYYGKDDDYKNKTFKIIEIENPLESHGITITPEGNVYITAEANRINELKSGRQIAYSGEFIGMLNKTIISRLDGKISIKAFN